MLKLCGCYVLLPELGAVPGDGELDGVAVGEAVSALGLVGAPYAALELDDGPGVAAGQGGAGDPGEVPGEALQVVGGYSNIALQNTVAEGIFLKQLQTLLIGKMASSFFRHNLFYGIIRAETSMFSLLLKLLAQVVIDIPDKCWR